jgi:hypothetical protein
MESEHFLKLKWNKTIPVEQINLVHQKHILNLLNKYPDTNIWFGYSATIWREAFKIKDKYLENLKRDNELGFKQINKIKEEKYKKINQEVDKLVNSFPVLKDYLNKNM